MHDVSYLSIYERGVALIKNTNTRNKCIYCKVGVIKFNGINYLATKRSRVFRREHSNLQRVSKTKNKGSVEGNIRALHGAANAKLALINN